MLPSYSANFIGEYFINVALFRVFLSLVISTLWNTFTYARR